MIKRLSPTHYVINHVWHAMKDGPYWYVVKSGTNAQPYGAFGSFQEAVDFILDSTQPEEDK